MHSTIENICQLCGNSDTSDEPQPRPGQSHPGATNTGDELSPSDREPPQPGHSHQRTTTTGVTGELSPSDRTLEQPGHSHQKATYTGELSPSDRELEQPDHHSHQRAKTTGVVTGVLSPSDRELQRRPVTIGIPGMQSPMGVQRLSQLWHRVKETRLIVVPQLKFTCHPMSNVEDPWTQQIPDDEQYVRIYCIIHWRVQNPDPAMLRPKNWHTTLLRATAVYTKALPWHLEYSELRLRHIMSVFWPERSMQLHLSFPPWRRSWNFGLDKSQTQVCQMIRESCKHFLMEANERFIWLQPDREIHVSWN